MKTFFSRSFRVLLVALMVFLGSCVGTVLEAAHAAGEHGESHDHIQVSEHHEDNHSSDSSDHDHSDGEHCAEGEALSVHNNILELQRVISEKINVTLPELALHPIRKLHVGIEAWYDPGSIALNSFQGHIRSVLIRV